MRKRPWREDSKANPFRTSRTPLPLASWGAKKKSVATRWSGASNGRVWSSRVRASAASWKRPGATAGANNFEPRSSTSRHSCGRSAEAWRRTSGRKSNSPQRHREHRDCFSAFLSLCPLCLCGERQAWYRHVPDFRTASHDDGKLRLRFTLPGLALPPPLEISSLAC